MNRSLLLTLFFPSVFLSAIAIAQERPKELTGSAAQAAVKASLEQKVSLKFQEAPLKDVVKQLATVAKINVVLDKKALDELGLEVDQPVTVNVEKITLESALKILLAPHGLGYTTQGDVLLITSAAGVKQRENRSEIKAYMLKYVQADQVATTLGRLFSEELRIVSDPRMNTLIATGSSKEAFDKLEESLNLIDRGAAKSKETTRIFPMSGDHDPGDVYFEKVLKLATRGLEIEFVVDQIRKMIIVRGNEEDIDEFSKVFDVIERHTQLAQHDASAKEAEAADHTHLRIFLLTNGAPENETKELPKELAAAANSMSKLGVVDLKLATQLIVKIGEAGESFSVSGMTSFGGVALKGMRKNSSSMPMHIELSMKTELEKSLQPTSFPPVEPSVESTVKLSPGQLVVLGAAPLGSAQIVIVVQLAKTGP